MVNLSYQVSNLSMSIAIIYTQHYIITPAIPILNHQPHGFIFEIRRVIYKEVKKNKAAAVLLLPGTVDLVVYTVQYMQLIISLERR